MHQETVNSLQIWFSKMIRPQLMAFELLVRRNSYLHQETALRGDTRGPKLQEMEQLHLAIS